MSVGSVEGSGEGSPVGPRDLQHGGKPAKHFSLPHMLGSVCQLVQSLPHLPNASVKSAPQRVVVQCSTEVGLLVGVKLGSSVVGPLLGWPVGKTFGCEVGDPEGWIVGA